MSTFTLIGKVVGYSRGGTPGGKDTQKYNIDCKIRTFVWVKLEKVLLIFVQKKHVV